MKRILAIALVFNSLMFFSCSESTDSTKNETGGVYVLNVVNFGGMVDSQQVKQCVITNPSGMTVKILNYGEQLPASSQKTNPETKEMLSWDLILFQVIFKMAILILEVW